MKTMWLVALLGITSAQAQNVFVLGSNTALPPDLNGNVQPVATAPAAAVATPSTVVNVNVNVTPAANCAQPGYYDPYNAYYPQQYYSPNVTYIGSPGTCGPNYNNYYPYQNSSVIYFGGMQAYRQGYHFRHCR
jgi:hypothetical protein